MTQRLRLHAARFHGHANPPAVIRKYAEAAETFDRAAARRHAAHVAAWIAYVPEGRAPRRTAMRLLLRLLAKLGGGSLPARLEHVLPEALALLEATEVEGHAAWNHASSELKRRLRKLRCCRAPVPVASGAATSAPSSTEMNLKADGVAPQAVEVAASAGPAPTDRTLASEASRMHAKQLFRKMNAWRNMAPAEQVECLRQVEATMNASHGQGRLQEDALAEVLTVLAAALSAPRRAALLQDGGADCDPFSKPW